VERENLLHRTCPGLAATIHGSNGPDTMQGTSGDWVIVGLDVDDTMYNNYPCQ
jgi:hypothetical protein